MFQPGRTFSSPPKDLEIQAWRPAGLYLALWISQVQEFTMHLCRDELPDTLSCQNVHKSDTKVQLAYLKKKKKKLSLTRQTGSGPTAADMVS